LVATNHVSSSFQEFLHTHHEIWDRATYLALLEDLVNHILIHSGNNPLSNPRNNPFWTYLDFS
jgi:hypothetical protein